ncbi:MAG: hypothetical protein PUP93_30355 [Rhizonema sp. NSF051]|nr:hypothetical protein [Rhizonema sp. NSF051]
MKLESSAFTANGLIRAKYTCDGENISLPLTWDESSTLHPTCVYTLADKRGLGGSSGSDASN